jgi:formyl-CoA transferase
MLNVEPGPLMRVQASQSYAMTCSDGKMIAVHMSSQDKFWKGCTEAFKCAHLATDPRFDTRAKRVDNYVDLATEFRKAAVSQPREIWMARLAERDVPHAPVNSLLEVIEDPQIRHLGTFADMKHPVSGSYKTVRRPVRYDGSRDDQPLNLPPELNADGAAILGELGVSDADIAAWESHNRKLVDNAA